MGGTPEEKPAVYRKANVLPDVKRIRTPLLIMHGEEDSQVPPQESVEFVAALKQAGKTYSYITYPNEGHGFRSPEHRLDSMQRGRPNWLGWHGLLTSLRNSACLS